MRTVVWLGKGFEPRLTESEVHTRPLISQDIFSKRGKNGTRKINWLSPVVKTQIRAGQGAGFAMMRLTATQWAAMVIAVAIALLVMLLSHSRSAALAPKDQPSSKDQSWVAGREGRSGMQAGPAHSADQADASARRRSWRRCSCRRATSRRKPTSRR